MQIMLKLILTAALSLLSTECVGIMEAGIQGRLQISKGKAAVLVEADKQIPLVSEDADIASVLGDERVSGRQVKLVGRTLEDGSFSVREFYVVRRDLLYRLVYFCATCNITAFAPGDCACCQQPTVPTEVLPTDPRIYHQGAAGPPPGH